MSLKTLATQSMVNHRRVIYGQGQHQEKVVVVNMGACLWEAKPWPYTSSYSYSILNTYPPKNKSTICVIKGAAVTPSILISSLISRTKKEEQNVRKPTELSLQACVSNEHRGFIKQMEREGKTNRQIIDACALLAIPIIPRKGKIPYVAANDKTAAPHKHAVPYYHHNRRF